MAAGDPPRELGVLAQIAWALNGSIELSQALDATLGHTASLLGLETGWIWLLAEDGSGFYLAASRALPPGFAANPAWVQGSCYCQSLFGSGQLEAARNIDVIGCSRLHDLAEQGAAPTAGLGYHASVPLVAHGRRLGILNLASPDWRELAEAELALLRAVSDMVAVAVERTRLFRRAQELGALLERQRVARDVHADVLTRLAESKRTLERLRRAIVVGSAPGQWLEPVSEALTHVEDSVEATRHSLSDLGGLGRAAAPGPTLPEALELLDHAHAPRPELTPREWELLPLLARGLSNRELAERLHISVRTAKFHVSSLISKFDALNRTEVVSRALRLGMLGARDE